MTDLRVADTVVEVLYASAAILRVSDTVLEVLYASTATLRVSDTILEVLYASTASLNVSTVAIEILTTAPPLRKKVYDDQVVNFLRPFKQPDTVYRWRVLSGFVAQNQQPYMWVICS